MSILASAGRFVQYRFVIHLNNLNSVDKETRSTSHRLIYEYITVIFRRYVFGLFH